jgi:hypothetical protein
MRVNICGKWYDADHIPIQIELREKDKENIANMSPEARNYVVFPDELGWDEAKKILKIEEKTIIKSF